MSVSVSVEQDMVAAYRSGLLAARSGKLVSANPFDPAAGKASVRILAKMWLRGYGQGNPVVDDSESLEVRATVVRVGAHTRQSRHGVEHVDAYTYLRKPGMGEPSSSERAGAVSGPVPRASKTLAKPAPSKKIGSSAEGPSDSGVARPVRSGMHTATPEDHERLAKDGIKLPPAWTDVQVSDDPGAGLQAVGYDSKGRSQYVYSSAHTSRQSQAKFARIRALRAHMSDIDHRLQEDVASSDHAAALMLIRRLGLRPGSDEDTGAEKKAFGATNMLVEHVKVDGDSVRLTFTGKKGVDLDFTVEDSELAAVLASRVSGKSPQEKLFETNERRTAAYLHAIAKGFKVKDLRTYYGTMYAFKVVEDMPVPKTAAEATKARKEVANQVSAKLGNTPTVALASYIDPMVFAEWDSVEKEVTSNE